MSHPAAESTSIGVGGAWVAQLRELERFYYVFVAIAIGAFGYAFYRLYVRPVPCDPDTACAVAPFRRRQRIAFWITLIVAKLLVLFPFYGPQLLA